MTGRRVISFVAAAIFLLLAAANLYRLMYGYPITIGGHMVGGTISYFIMVASIAISIILFRGDRTAARR